MIHYSCCSYLCTRLRLMWWNPHGEMMCSAEGWQSRGEGLAMSEACWTTYMFRTTAPVCQRRDSTNPLCSHYLPEFFLSFLLCGDLCSCLSLYSFHVSYHTFDLCLLFAGAWKSTTMSCLGQWFECCKGKEELYQFHSFDLNYSSPSPEITWRYFLRQRP